ncbi:MAG: hypothetical protein INH41_04925 [Myxococcaceae bacterium]|nr:hypothetical protein [Myxococcaceae bacterium]MCA3011726.1 hypothetical protein [Myxococcaceae bacterium]
MTTCTGLLLLGLCLPIPGMTRESIEKAGWVASNDQPGSADSYASVWMRWNELTLLVGVNVDGDRVKLVHINESKNRSVVTVEGWLKAHCRAAGDNWACSVGKRRFDATPCAGGWALGLENQLQADGGVAEMCRRLTPLFTAP